MPQEGYPNLMRPTEDRTAEQRRESARNAGRASGAARRRLRTFAEVARAILDSPETDEETVALLQSIGLDGTKRDTMTLAQILKASRGDTDAFRIVRDTVGEKPREELEIGGLADRPIATLDLSKLSDDDLRRLAQAKSEGT